MPYSCEHVVEIEHEPRHHLVIANQFIRAFAVEIAPHDRTLCHHHPHDYLLYVAGGAEIISAAHGEEPKQLNYSEDECELSPAGMTHVVENLSDTPFRNVVVELLPDVAGLRRGASPQAAAGEASITELFTDARAAIFAINLEPDGEVLLRGPVVVGCPADAADLEEPGDSTTSLHHFRSLVWLPPDRSARLTGSAAPSKVVLFQVGVE